MDKFNREDTYKNMNNELFSNMRRLSTYYIPHISKYFLCNF